MHACMSQKRPGSQAQFAREQSRSVALLCSVLCSFLSCPKEGPLTISSPPLFPSLPPIHHHHFTLTNRPAPFTTTISWYSSSRCYLGLRILTIINVSSTAIRLPSRPSLSFEISSFILTPFASSSLEESSPTSSSRLRVPHLDLPSSLHR
ncbi:hypothetical protein BKA65DRAFT_117602 [Rhexocercosporidium sp. MPI-PUGE-AT-0058]|nr:hypothetical protein BKA65DRAFT_117602 [Rhexocercosporidium sp. MPI-PUGE-AT-0058]